MSYDCPCCDGRMGGDWRDLCDDCAAGWMAEQWPHPGCRRGDLSPTEREDVAVND